MIKNKITFIIPSLNRETLTKSVNSLLNQTNPNWKCIIVYDGVDGLSFNDERIITIKVNKLGINGDVHGQSGLVRNHGIKMVDTEWIGFLDDDDTINPNYVEVLLSNYNKFDFIVWRMGYQNGLILPEITRNDLVFGGVGISISYKNKFSNLLFDNNRDGEDFDFLMKLKKLTDNWIITPEVYYNVRH
jgi:glycosyltransferase involved in cell wall biosynthesis